MHTVSTQFNVQLVLNAVQRVRREPIKYLRYAIIITMSSQTLEKFGQPFGHQINVYGYVQITVTRAVRISCRMCQPQIVRHIEIK